eukprot:TRINITY_DN418_c0_g1_i1.p1 TRINITY_DN418_c0_g1~~TRINITY_DN418_c0_g1_i1.p1  ORF type:complete len:255 (+),score=46.48 TRINITY_DN418_c0_g1_i1:234-998(+)
MSSSSESKSNKNKRESEEVVDGSEDEESSETSKKIKIGDSPIVPKENFFSRMMNSALAKTVKTPKLWEYTPAAISKTDSDRLYTVLRGVISDERDIKTMYGKEYSVRRRYAYFSKFVDEVSHDSASSFFVRGWIPELQELEEIAVKFTNAPFDSALVNFYENGDDYISAHADRECKGTLIASFSFGATREFLIREKETKKVVDRLDLESGSLLVMKVGMQESFLHELPKRPKVKTGRINVTMRYHGKKQKPGDY